MKPVQLPTIVPGHGWPILSAIRYGTSDTPAELIIVVDCGEGTPIQPYATMHVYAWPDRVKFRDGEYNLTFAQAQRSMLERAGLLAPTTVEVVVLRDPDRANDDAVFIDGTHRPDAKTARVRVRIHDIDPRAADITASWAAQQRQRMVGLSEAATAHVRTIIAGYTDEEGVEVPGV